MDVHFQPVPDDEVLGYKIFTFGFTSALKVSGLQALVNRWVKTFMTPVGSDVYEPSSGTEFGDLIGSNINGGSSDLLDVVVMSVDDANEQVEQQDLEGRYPADESLQSAKLLKFLPNTAGDGIEVWVEITNKEGQTLNIRLADQATR